MFVLQPRAPVVARSSSDTCDRQKPQDIVPYQEYIQGNYNITPVITIVIFPHHPVADKLDEGLGKSIPLLL